LERLATDLKSGCRKENFGLESLASARFRIVGIWSNPDLVSKGAGGIRKAKNRENHGIRSRDLNHVHV
jgi:hypothetical protein